MNTDADQPHLLSDSSVHIIDATVTEETPLTDQPVPDDEQEIQPTISPNIYWTTSELCQVCREGDIDRLRAFTEYSQQTSQCGKHASEIADRLDIETGLSPLHHAARYQQLHICLMFLSNIKFELGVNIKDTHDRTPMHSAFRSSNNLNPNKSNPEKEFKIDTDFGNKIQDIEIWQEEYQTKILTADHPLIYLFAKANGDINARDKYLLTPLHYAVARNNLSGVKQLIKLNADIESQDRQGIRPLHLACKEGYLSIVEYLVEQNTKINTIDADYWTPLHYACSKGHLDIIKLINTKHEKNFQKLIEMKTNTNASCLHLAVQHGNIQLVEYILNQFQDHNLKILINELAEPFGTPLHIAAKFCDSSMIDLLYHYGADPLTLNSNNQSCLHIACTFNRLSIVKELYTLTPTSLLEIKDNNGQTALSVTANTDILHELIKYGADISSLDNHHMNVLMIAVTKNQLSIVEHLLLVIDDQLNYIFNQITKQNHRSVFLLAVRTGSIQMCSLLLTHPNIHWNTIDKQRLNAFHIAARYNHSQLIEFLCNHIRKSEKLSSQKSSNTPDLDINNISFTASSPSSNLRLYLDGQNEDGKTPLHFAAEQGYSSCIEVLLKYGADILLPNYVGQLALHVAIQNGHSQCVDLLTKNSIKNLADFQSVLSRKQSPLLTACQNGYIDIVRLLLSQDIRFDYDNNNNHQDENPLEIAIKYRQIDILHELLEHPNAEDWLMSTKKTGKFHHQTPLRDMIRYIPECAKHTFDKFIIKTNEIDSDGNMFEKIQYNYKFIDDYFINHKKLYAKKSHQLYRNHPFIIALDSEHHSLLEHPFARQLISRKWKIYRPLFYLTFILTFLLLFISTFYVLIIPAPNLKSSTNKSVLSIEKYFYIIQWIIVILSGINLLKIFLEIFLYRGLRVPFAQIFGIVSFLTSILAFVPYKKTIEILNYQWELAALSTLCQWFNIALILRSVPFIGNFIIMFQSILMNFLSLIFVILPLLIAFTIGKYMIFYNQSSFLTIQYSIHKLTAMIIGEFDYETLFYSKPTFHIAAFLFTPFIFIMAIVFMNFLLGLTIGDLQICMENAQAKANAYRIRELIYIESTLPSLSWLKSNIIENETIPHYPKDSILRKNDDDEEENDDDDEDYHGSLSNRQQISQLGKLLDILNMLSTQAKQALEQEIYLEIILKQLLTVRNSLDSTTD